MRTDEAFHQYQKYCVGYLVSHERCGLFLDMGLGKTAITLKAISDLMNDYLEVRRVLVVAPLRVAKLTWRDELRKWEDLSGLTLAEAIGNAADRAEAIRSGADITTINRENVKWLYDYYMSRREKPPFDMVVIDESSSFKNRASQRWKAMKALTAYAKRVVLLTGTPVPNGFMDLWAQIYLIDRGQRLGQTLTAYRDRYFVCRNQRFRQYELRPSAEEQIEAAVKDVCVSMKSEDYLTLPEKVENTVTVELDEASRKAYREMERNCLLELDGKAITAANAAVVLSKLIQLAGGAAYDDSGGYSELHRAKIDALREIVEENEGKPILVFYNFVSEKERLARAFAELGPRELRNEEDQADWNAGKIRMMLCNPASAGHGLNLQAGGHIVVWFSLTWNLEYYEQANRRLYRQGQKESVVINHLIAEGTIDANVLSRLKGKDRRQEGMLEYIKARITEVSENVGK